MTTCAPWTNPVRHPYLANPARPSLKRKHSYCTSASSEAASASTDHSPTSDASELPSFAQLPDSADTTIDASQDPYMHHQLKKRRYESLGVEGEFDDLALEQRLRAELMSGASNGETTTERQERFWEMDGEIEVDMDTGSYSSSRSVLHPALIESPMDQKVGLENATSGRNWYEAEKDRIVITSLDSDSDSVRSSPTQPALALENGELISKAVVAALKGESLLATPGTSALFDARRWGDLTPLERMTAGMSGMGPFSDAEMSDATPQVEMDEMAMDIEEM